MFTKKILLAGIAAGAFAIASSASALTISTVAGGTPVAGTETGGVATNAGSVYTIAAEVNTNPLASTAGQFASIITPNTKIPSGTYQVILTYSNATIAAAPTGTAIAATTAAGATGGASSANGDAGFSDTTTVGASTATLQLASGAVGSNTMTYNLQVNNPPGGTDVINSLFFAPALNVTAVPVGLTVQVINTASGQNIQFEPAAQSNIIAKGKAAFNIAINGAYPTPGLALQASNTAGAGTGAAGLTQILGGANAFKTISADSQIGQVYYTVNTGLYKNLNGQAVAATDVSGESVSVVGNLTGLNITEVGSGGAAGPAVPAAGGGAVVTAVYNGNVSATFNFGVGGNPNQTYSVAAIGGAGAPVLAPTGFAVAASLTLGAGFTSPPATTGYFEPLSTQGISYVIPWVNSASQGSGNSTLIRISNLDSTTFSQGATVYGILYNAATSPTFPGSVNVVKLGALGTPVNFVGTPNTPQTGVATGTLSSNELVINSTDLQNAFGSFTRGDLRLIIQSNAETAFSNAGVAQTQTVTQEGTASPTPPVANTAINPGASSILVKRVFVNASGGVSEMTVQPGDAVVPAPVTQSVQP